MSEFDEGPGYYEMKHALKRMEHGMKHAEREKIHAIKDAIKRDVKNCKEAGYFGERPSPRTVDDVLVEVDSYISYLEDLPKEKLAPYEEKVDRLVEHLEKVRSSLKNDKRSGDKQ